MVSFSRPVSELIRRRYSCRAYQTTPIPDDLQRRLAESIDTLGSGPFGSAARFMLVAARDDDAKSLRGLGTYGFIKNAPGYLIGAGSPDPMALVDFGYLFEALILAATDLELGTCWLGGTFTKSRFARKIEIGKGEIMPAAVSIGLADDEARLRGELRLRMGMNRRLDFDRLFFDGGFDSPLDSTGAGEIGPALEAVRWAPSASNKQPWRVVRHRGDYHFYMQRTPHYGKGSLVFTLLRLADLQRVDLGIAICHFDLVVRESGASGKWVVDDPGLGVGRDDTAPEYIATWRP